MRPHPVQDVDCGLDSAKGAALERAGEEERSATGIENRYQPRDRIR
jgi:hypothetical protein